MIHIAIFASGRGSNAVEIHKHGSASHSFCTSLIVTNRADAGVLKYADENNIATHLIERKGFYDDTTLLGILKSHEIDLIVLAGFLWLIPPYLVQAYPKKIINIHPALLPAYGGKGMYGMHIHRAIAKAKEEYSGITIHFVNEEYDEGAIILQTKCPVKDLEPDAIASQVLRLEHYFYPRVVEGLSSHLNPTG